jgi:uncharacterized membrane protein HdeD (DUF308 family)
MHSIELSRASLLLFLRGFLLVLFASVAIRWPEETLVTALTTAGVVVATLGVIEIGLAMVTATRRANRALMVAHAILSLGFGAVALSVGVYAVSTTIYLTLAWLLLQAAFALLLLHITPQVGPAKLAVFGWVSTNVVSAMLLMANVHASLTELLYFAALYAWAYGVAQISVALWIRRHLRLVAAPR